MRYISSFERDSKIEPVKTNSNNSGLAFLAGTAVVGIPALAYIVSKNQQHQQEVEKLTSIIKQLNSIIREKDVELLLKNFELASEKAARTTAENENAHLRKVNIDLAATVKAQELQNTAKIFPREDNDNNLN